MNASVNALFDPRPIERFADEVAGKLKPGELLVVEGSHGAGRTQLARYLEQFFGQQLLVVRVPSAQDADAPLHVLLQAAAAVSPDCVSMASDGRRLLVKRAIDVVRALAERDRTLLLVVPPRFPVNEIADDVDAPESWLSTFVRIIQKETQLALALLLPQGEARAAALPKTPMMQLPACYARIDALDDATAWGSYAPSASALRRALGTQPPSVTPLQVRLMVGLVGLGVPPSAVVQRFTADRIGESPSLVPLARQLATTLRDDSRADIRAATRRLLLLRAPLPADDAMRIANAPKVHEPLLRHCVGYGDGELRVPDFLRSFLLHKLRVADDEAAAHRKIADHHANPNLDGATSAFDAASAPGDSSARVAHWLEKVHHLAHAGPLGAADWLRQDLRSREFLIDRARALSITERDYLGAARLYEQCLVYSSKDAYSLHYRGYNLDRAGSEPAEVERCFSEAVGLRSENLFYNSRLVTFLIEQGRFVDAERAWEQARKYLEHRSPQEIVYHVMVHVVGAWLRSGEVARARRVFDEIPLEAIEAEVGDAVDRLEHRLCDAEEAELLGVSVYPAGVEMRDRWNTPRVAPDRLKGLPRKAWYPGRIVAADATHVGLALAVPDVDPAKRRVIARDIDAEEWSRIANWSEARDASGFVELAVYGEPETVMVFQVRDLALPRHGDELSVADPMRYLMKSVLGSPLG